MSGCSISTSIDSFGGDASIFCEEISDYYAKSFLESGFDEFFLDSGFGTFMTSDLNLFSNPASFPSGGLGAFFITFFIGLLSGSFVALFLD